MEKIWIILKNNIIINKKLMIVIINEILEKTLLKLIEYRVKEAYRLCITK